MVSIDRDTGPRAMCRQLFRLFRVNRLTEMVLPDAGHHSQDHLTLGTRAASRHWATRRARAQKTGLLTVENGNDYCVLCTFFFLQLILSCNNAFIHCVNYYVCPVDPDELMMSNVYTVFFLFFICDMYLSKVSSNESERVCCVT